MPILILLALLNIGALYFFVVSKSLGIKCMAALYSFVFTLVGAWIWTGHILEDNNLHTLHFTGYNFIVVGYGLLAAACVSVLVQGIRKARSGFAFLGLIVFVLALGIMWLGYELTHATWKVGG